MDMTLDTLLTENNDIDLVGPVCANILGIFD